MGVLRRDVCGDGHIAPLLASLARLARPHFERDRRPVGRGDLGEGVDHAGNRRPCRQDGSAWRNDGGARGSRNCRLCGSLVCRKLLAADLAQPRRADGTIGADAARRYSYPRRRPLRRSRLWADPPLGLDEPYLHLDHKRRSTSIVLGRAGASTVARRLGARAPRVPLYPVGPPGRGCGSNRWDRCSRPRYRVLDLYPCRVGSAGEPPSVLWLWDALLALTGFLGHDDRLALGGRGPPKSCSSGRAGGCSLGSGRSD
jgi:hypothetical protein